MCVCVCEEGEAASCLGGSQQTVLAEPASSCPPSICLNVSLCVLSHRAAAAVVVVGL